MYATNKPVEAPILFPDTDKNSTFTRYTNIFETLDGKYMIGLSLVFFLYFSYISGSFLNPFEWVSLFGIISGCYFLFFGESPFVKSLRLTSVLHEIEEIQETERQTRKEELKTLVRDIRITLLSGSGLAIKDKFKRCLYMFLLKKL